MEKFRKILSEQAESDPVCKKILGLNYIFWSLGLILYIVGGSLTWISQVTADILGSMGIWILVFGLIAAFIKKNDWGLLISTCCASLFNLVMFILMILLSKMIRIDYMIHAFGFAIVFIIVLRASDFMKEAELRKAQEAALFARQMQSAGGTVCASCGFIFIGDTAFCPKCGAKHQESVSCKTCGAVIKDNDQFCPKCGTSLHQ
ncbi:MAG: zinc ribbon domain-containing protein [Lachnospiraceae bacterium]